MQAEENTPHIISGKGALKYRVPSSSSTAKAKRKRKGEYEDANKCKRRHTQGQNKGCCRCMVVCLA
jgi:hypothetical protein